MKFRQSVINAAARLIFAALKSDRITPLLEEPYWLYLKGSDSAGVSLLIVVFNEGTAPACLADSLRLTTMEEGRRCLWSAETMELLVPATRCKTLGDRAFPVAAARTWNALPSSIRLASSLYVLL